MKVWKSPIFYFGLLLLIAVTGAMAAPFVIDWNAYRADLENYGRKLTGRTVNIDGAISVRLFPWPRLTADNVRLAGPPGREPADFASAQRITVRVTLAGLFNGQLHVESVDIEEPSITIERQETGEGNWTFTPAADLAKSELLAQVKLDRVTHTGLKRMLVELYALHENGIPPELDNLRVRLIDRPDLAAVAMELQDVGRSISERPTYFHKVVEGFAKVKTDDAKRSLKQQLGGADMDDAAKLEILRQLQNRTREAG